MSKLIDLRGKRYGRLIVIERAENSKNGRVRWKCKCDCGNVTIVAANNLRNGHTTSCGCLRSISGKNNLDNLTGMRFGKLIVLEILEKRQGKNVLWKCKCDCGNVTIVAANNLRNGHTTSCGCVQKEKIISASTTHGKSKTRLYRIWKNMKNRCLNPNVRSYKDYGGRGITICNEWLQNFEEFYQWAMSHGYADNLSIDRRDNDKGYFPENCHWTTAKEQANNRRKRS